MIGMFSVQENRDRLESIERRLKSSRLDEDERAELELFKAELQAWFRALERAEG